MFTISKKDEGSAEPKLEVLSLRITKTQYDALYLFSKNYNYEIYEPIREFIGKTFLPALKRAALKEDEDIKLKARQESEDYTPELEA
jgi:hypothetical protein